MGDMSGSVDIDEFVAFYNSSTDDSGYKAKEEVKHTKMTHANITQRRQRIEKKTNLAVAVSLISKHLRKQIVKYLAKHELSRRALFDIFDEDLSGLIDRNEYYIGLESCGFDINYGQLDIIWSMFDKEDD